mmetsp:Transcript_44930/g.88919  ORF Transcript_44930/g.88919 Transcript_44930/m.88919 type:complete len:98 (-) Transcript_44930:57-350(-)|eukprot:CAMPEP_0172851460 /NCGR_PEP_ID=MMETSP1075-20121228/51652_1 /TAXON_ID=2916 /ORGANISM="Ceratium fusus, Strain PA161109" /LENGTH=97 /DNA_ID=CAMNT_0013697491 /DNA_START=591 /DNA_END=884 /DNA_ORIENTATION=+
MDQLGLFFRTLSSLPERSPPGSVAVGCGTPNDVFARIENVGPELIVFLNALSGCLNSLLTALLPGGALAALPPAMAAVRRLLAGDAQQERHGNARLK